MSDDAALSLRNFFTLQKIAYYAAPPALMVRPSAVEIYKIPADSPRLRNSVLGFGESGEPGEAQSEKKEIMFLMVDLDAN